MITSLLLLLIVAGAAGVVIWPIWQGIRQPWMVQSPSGEQEAIHQEQLAALDALRDLAMDYKLGNLSLEDYRALAAPLQQKARRTLERQEKIKSIQREPGRTGSSAAIAVAEAELDALLESRIQALRRVVAPSNGGAVRTAVAGQRFCHQCGAPVQPGFHFCASCGVRLETVQPSEQQPLEDNGRAVAPQEIHQGPGQLPASPVRKTDAAPSSSAATSETTAPSSRRKLWGIGAVLALVWVVAVVWLYMSTRAGQQNQVPVATFPNTTVWSIGATDGLLVLGESKGLQVSTDGLKWNPLPVADEIHAIAALDDAGQRWLAAGAKGLWSSTNGATSWQPLATDPAELHLLTITSFPGQSGVVLGADETAIYMSEDGGQTWTNMNVKLPGLPRSLVAGDLGLFIGTDRGVYRSEDGGQSWINFNGSVNGVIASTDIQALAYDGKNQMLYAGTPAGLSFMNLGSPGGWGHRSLQANVTALTLAGPDKQVVWVGTADGQLFRSDDRGVTWR
jgi:photosystem II stability/assembly factor-like uncharacterized protein/rRNA maturation endonuclease Nob1